MRTSSKALTRALQWLSAVSKNRLWVSTEVDPFKYTSWPMNASVQAWTLTQELEQRLAALERSRRMGELPPILAMQSAIDATVIVPKLITVLFDRIQPGGPCRKLACGERAVTVMETNLRSS